MDYITSADITHVHLKQFPIEVLTPYITEANVWIEDIAIQMNVYPEMITTASGPIVKRYLANYINYRFAEDSIGTNNTEITDDDMYVRMYDTYYGIAETMKKQITPELLMGTANGDKPRSVSMGKMFRTA